MGHWRGSQSIAALRKQWLMPGEESGERGKTEKGSKGSVSIWDREYGCLVYTCNVSIKSTLVTHLPRDGPG